MSQNSEQIEAKLCAYLEGELDEQGRAEIEKHLEANPAHRKLLAEVGQTRGMLRALPRESAPPDICEAFQGQLERSVLLSDLNDGSESTTLRINRWPQYFAVAAVVMLAAGLGMVVYFGLPSAVPQPAPYAIGGGGVEPQQDGVVPGGGSIVLTPPVTQTFNEGVARDGATRGGGVGTSMDEARSNDFADASGNSGVRPAATAPGAPQDLVALARRVHRSWEPSEGGQLFSTATSPDVTRAALADLTPNAHYYVVASAQPAVASEHIGQELTRLQVAWSAVPAPDADTVRQTLAARTALHDRSFYRQNRGMTLAEREQIEPARGLDAQVRLKKDSGAAATGSPPSAAAEEMPGTSATPAPTAAHAPTPAPAPTAGAVATRGPSTRPSEAPDVAEGSASGVATTGNEGSLADQPAAQEKAGPGEPVARRPATLIIARNLTREQAHTLGISLNERQSAQPLAPADAPGLAPDSFAGGAVPETLKQEVQKQQVPTSPAAPDSVIRQGDALRLEVAAAGGDFTVTDVTVGQDGNAAIPGVGLFRCAGLTVDQLQEQLAKDMGQNAPAGRVAVSRLGEERKEKEVAAEMDRVAAPGAAAASGSGATPSAAAGPGTAPAGGAAGARGNELATGEAEERLAGRARMARPAPAPDAVNAPDAAARGAATTNQAGRVSEPGQLRQRYGVSAGAAGMPAPQTGGPASQVNPARPAQPPGAPSTTSLAASAEERFDVVIVVDDLADPVAAAPAESGEASEPAGPIEKYEILTVQVGDAESDAANVRVGEDGTVELPELGRVKAQGLTAAELRAEIGAKLKQSATGGPERNVLVRRLVSEAAAPADTEAGKSSGAAPSVQSAPAQPVPVEPAPADPRPPESNPK